jgi:hypothetical protein
VGKDFNTKSFVHVNQYASFDDAIQHIIEIDQDEEKYRQIANETWFHNNKVPEEMENESFQEFFDFVISDIDKNRPVGASWAKSKLHRMNLFREKLQSIVNYYLKINKSFR